MKSRVVFINKKSVHLDPGVELGANVVLHENVIIKGCSKIGDGVEIFANTVIDCSEIGEGSVVISSFIENSKIGPCNTIGPFTRIRPGTETEKNVKLGNFVEVKNSFLGEGTKAAHLSYIGDADVGKNVNIGCGAIFVNYDGKQKKRIVVGDGAFIGSNCNLIAPVKIAKKSYICAGTTVTQSTEEEDFVIGRVVPTVKEKRAKKYLD